MALRTKQKNAKPPKVFAFDFDGVLAQYWAEFKGDTNHGMPIYEVVEAIRILKKEGYKIIIHSTKSTKTIKEYCKKFDIPVDYINENPNYKTGNPGKPVATVYIDDRAYCYKGQNALKLVKDLKSFQPYWRKS